MDCLGTPDDFSAMDWKESGFSIKNIDELTQPMVVLFHSLGSWDLGSVPSFPVGDEYS